MRTVTLDAGADESMSNEGAKAFGFGLFVTGSLSSGEIASIVRF
jgi:hypothetical protein